MDDTPTESTTDNEWVSLAADAYSQGIRYIDTNYRKQWENNIRYFNSKHHSGSKYLKDSYKYRSRLFRPKTRSALRSNEAAASAAFFANMDVLKIEPSDPNDMIEVLSAEFQEELLQIRLEKSIPWFLTCQGAFQDTQKLGVVISYQCWAFAEKEVSFRAEVVGEDGNQATGGDGQPMYTESSEKVVLKDKPNIELRPVENIIIHPSSDWVDPIMSTPYIIDMIPMYVQDIKLKMLDGGYTKPWIKLTDGQIFSATKQNYDSTRTEREDGRTDKYDNAGSGKLSRYDIAWVHRNIMRMETGDVVFYTLGVDHLLSEPVALEEEYPWCRNGERPYVMGIAVIETHKLYPSGVGQLGEEVQKEINETVNQRRDNVKFVLNKRWFVRRGSQVDLKSMVRNVAGSVTMMGDVDKDARAIEFNDVTGSAYMEQDRLNLDFDEVTGAFSSSSISSNRKLNETVGGMSMLRGETNSLKEYTIKIFSETWVKKVLYQVLMMEREYESDEVLMRLAAKKSRMFQKLGINPSPEILQKLLDFEFSTTVNVGMGSTDPVLKVNNFRLGIDTISNLARNDQKGIFKIDEVAAEVFGRIGYEDGRRFVNEIDSAEDPEKAQLVQAVQGMQQQIAELSMQLKSKMEDIQAKLMIQKMKEEGDTYREILGIQGDMALKRIENQNQLRGRQ